MWNCVEDFNLLFEKQVPCFWLVLCVFCFWPRLPETDDCGGDNYSSHVSFPVAACLCSYSPSFSPTFLRCSCAIPDGLAFQWPGWPVKTGAASRGKKNVELGCWCLWPWYRIWERRALGWAQGGITKFIFFYFGEHKQLSRKKVKTMNI